MKKLVAAAKELNELLGLSPKIKTVGIKEPALKKLLLEAAEALVEEDEEDVTKPTTETLVSIGAKLAWLNDEADEDEDEDEEEEDEAAEEEEEDEDEEEEEEAPKKKAKKEKAPAKAKGKKKAAPVVEEEDEEEEDEDEDEDEEEEAPVKKGKGKAKKEDKPAKKAKADKEDKPKGKRPEKASGKSGKGVIAIIVETLEKATKKKPVTKDDIHAILLQEFPDRDPKSMKNTVNVQVPGRISKERFPLEKTKDGKGFYKA